MNENSGDPLIGTSPSTLNNKTILTSVSLYYLTHTFENAGNIYYQNSGEFVPNMRHAANRVPMGFADYQYEVQYVYFSSFPESYDLYRMNQVLPKILP